MCLDKITQFNTRVSKNQITVYKIFRHLPSGRLEHWYICSPAVKGKWIKANTKRRIIPCIDTILTKDGRYPSGFHAFSRPNKKWSADAFERIFLAVLFRKVRTVGIDRGRKTLVAEEMYIPAKDEKIVNHRIVKIKPEKKVPNAKR